MKNLNLEAAKVLLGVSPSDTLQDIKTKYHRLAMTAHPDRPNGNLETMKSLSCAYEFLRETWGDLTQAEREHVKNSLDPEILARAVRIKNMNESLDVVVAGAWIWVTGESLRENKEQREFLKKEGFKFSAFKKAWFFAGCKSYSRKKTTLSEVFSNYGANSVSPDYSNRLGGSHA